ncbi:MAG TPA: hypothetical protein VMA98_08605 [Candidatus Acidoferrales bacterium]|nr:hypothetical protein [Candidatus Acidoferrales bacterium]
MNYAEFLRVRNCLRIFAIVLAGLIALAAIVRISVANQLNDGAFIINRVSNEPGTKIAHSVVDGHQRTTITNEREKTTIVIDDYGYGRRQIRIVEPLTGNGVTGHQRVGSMHFEESSSGGMNTIFIRTDEAVNFVIFLAISGVAMMIIATILGAPFANENKDHLEIALLKPVTRTRYALGVIGVDVAGILVAGMMALVAAIVSQAMFELPEFDFSFVDASTVALAVVLPLAWYAFLNASTASLKRGSGAVVGFSWPAGFALAGLAELPLQGTPVGNVFHAIFWSVSRVIPLSYSELNVEHGSVSGYPIPTRVEILCVLMLIYGALAVMQWRRVEAS